MTQLLNQIDNNYIQLTLNILRERKRKVIQLHLGFETGQAHSFDEISQTMNITRQRVQQIYKTGIERIKILLLTA